MYSKLLHAIEHISPYKITISYLFHHTLLQCAFHTSLNDHPRNLHSPHCPSTVPAPSTMNVEDPAVHSEERCRPRIPHCFTALISMLPLPELLYAVRHCAHFSTSSTSGLLLKRSLPESRHL